VEQKMSQEVTVHIRISDDLARELTTYWEEEIAAERAPPALRVAYRPAVRPRGGLGLTQPPELLLTIPPELWLEFAKKFAGAMGGVIGTGVGSFLWTKLKEFFERRNLPGPVLLSINEEKLSLDLAALSDEPPASLRRLDHL
jgi:hypothetical protein